MLYQIIYSSRATRPMSVQDLAQILLDARNGNEHRDVTGVLVYADGVFLQVLEGESVVLEALISSIGADTRHDSMKVFRRIPVTERAFQAWRMAYLTADAAEMSRWAGLDGTQTVENLLQQVQSDDRPVPRILVSIVEALAATSQCA